MRRIALPMAVTVAVVAWLASEPPPAAPGLPLDEEADEKLSIAWVEPVEVAPGEALLVHVTGLQDGASLHARISAGEQKLAVPVLHRDGARLALRMPRGAPLGMVKLRVYQQDRKSKPRLLQVRGFPVRDMARDTLGGLALFLVGLAIVGRALRNYAGQSIRVRLSALTKSPSRGAAVGSVLGALTQSTTSSAGILVGMLEARLLPQNAAAALLLGAHLGAASAGAVLPLFAPREALWVVVLGAVWTAAAGDRRARAFGHIVLGCGLLFTGLSLLQAGVRPLLSDPALLPYLHSLSGSGVAATAMAVGLGAALAALLQGPGPAFAVVLSLTQSTSLLGLEDGLGILAGTAVGATAGSFVVGWRAGQAGRQLALTHLLVGVVASAVALLGVPLWVAAAEALVAGDATALDYASRALRPQMAGHLSVAFALCQSVGILVCVPLLPLMGRIATRVCPTGRTPAQADSDLLSVLSACRTAILALGEVVETRERAPAVAAEHAIGRARVAVASWLRSMERDSAAESGTLATATACLHLASATDGALRVAERALERDLVTEAEGARHLARVHLLLVEGIEALLAHAQGRAPLELEQVQVREIRLNALEAEARRAPGANGEALADRLWESELTSACEGIGNHLYRLATALVTEAAWGNEYE